MADEGNFLVSAGAGSGKTFVLSQRVYRLIKEKKAKFSELLVLTFTKKAAFEMKNRIRNLVLESKEIPESEIASLSSECASSDITNFDAFFLQFVNANHYKLGLETQVTIADEGLIGVIRRRILEEILDRRYQEALAGKDPLFLDLVEHTSMLSDEYLVTILCATHRYLELQSDKRKWLREYEGRNYSPQALDALINEYVDGLKDAVRKAIVLASNYLEDMPNDAGALYGLYAISSPNDFLQALKEFKFERLKPYKGDEETKELRKTLRANVKKILDPKIKEASSYENIDDIKQGFLVSKQDVLTCLEIVGELDEKLEKFQYEHATFTFSKVASLARELLKNEEVAAEMRNKYKFVLVDEYQDTSDLQTEFLEMFSRGNSFFVGDIKQSIYMFRNANPKNFKKMMDEYRLGQGGELLTMANNYRSRKEVINAINEIFSRIMSEKVGDVDYSLGHSLNPASIKYEPSSHLQGYGLQSLTYEHDKERKIEEEEAELIAQDIRQKILSGYLVYDGNEKEKGRRCNYEDFAILLSTVRRPSQIYQKVFNKYQIPLDVTAERSVEEEEVYLDMKNLCFLANLNGGESEKTRMRLFASLARSYIFKMDDREIHARIKDGSYVSVPFYATLTRKENPFRSYNPVDAVTEFIKTFKIVEKLSLLGRVKENYAAVESFLSLASGASKIGWGFSEFCAYLVDLGKYDVPFSPSSPRDSSGAVRMMTIHASKGLEFEIVYFPYLSHGFGSGSEKVKNGSVPSSFAFSKPYGLLLLPHLTDEAESKTVRTNFVHSLNSSALDRESTSERMRLFYVALTRAKETMILVHQTDAFEKKKADILDSDSFADFLSFATPLPYGTKDPFRAGVQVEAFVADKEKPYSIEFREPRESYAKPISGKRASKANLGADMGALVYGERLHRYLEIVDLESKDTSFIASPKDRALIDKVLAMGVFADLKGAKVYREYVYPDHESGGQGSIDLFIKYADRIVLVDYKTKNIDDPEYLDQVERYASYLRSAFNVPVEKYLLSIIKGELKRVK